MPPQWWVMMRRSGSFSSRPENTMRDIATEVSNGQPSTCQISYLRTLLALVVGGSARPEGVHPDRQLVLDRHGLEDREELGVVERPPIHVGEDLHAARAEFVDGPVHLLAARPARCSSAATRRTPGTGPASACRSQPCRRSRPARTRRLLRAAKHLRCRGTQGQHLHDIGKLLHEHLRPRFQVPQHTAGQPSLRRYRHPSNGFYQLEIRRRQHVVVDVDFLHFSPQFAACFSTKSG